MKNKIALLAGSFDPITKGHEILVRRGLQIFDSIIVAVGENTEKKNLFTLDKRMEWIKKSFKDTDKVSVVSYKGLTVDFCHSQGIKYLLRGLRDSSDFLYEEKIANFNKTLAPDIESIYLISDLKENIISSSMIRELLAFNHDIKDYVSSDIYNDILREVNK